MMNKHLVAAASLLTIVAASPAFADVTPWPTPVVVTSTAPNTNFAAPGLSPVQFVNEADDSDSRPSYLPGALLMTAGAVLVGVGFITGVKSELGTSISTFSCSENNCSSNGSFGNGGVIMGIGGAAIIGGIIYDVAAWQGSSSKHERGMRVAPMVSRTATGGTTGVALSGSF